jgi:succinoglycan biosynthesis protein ExoA
MIPAAITHDTTPALVIIACLNEATHIEKLVHYLIAESIATPMEIIIADGGSTDGTVGMAQQLAEAHRNVHYITNPKRIQSAAINQAVATFGAAHTYLIRMDAHAHYPAGFCAALLADAARLGADSVVVRMHTVGKKGFQVAVAAAQNSLLGNGGAAHRSTQGDGEWVEHGHHALMRIAAFQAVGGYDEHFSHNEDAELDVRLTKAGSRIWLTGATMMDYHPRATPLALFTQYRNYGMGRLRTVLKHGQRLKMRQLLPVAIAPAAIMALATPLVPGAAAPLLAWVVLCLAYGALLAWRARQPLLALSGVALLLMHGGWSLGFWQGLVAHTKTRP